MGRGSLYDIIHDANYPLAFPLVMKLSIDILKGLQFIHSSGFVHRDMKYVPLLLPLFHPPPSSPSQSKINRSLNLLVDSNWNMKIADFGLSCAKAQASTSNTQVSLLWTAPEILLQEPNCYSERSDLYAYVTERGDGKWEGKEKGRGNKNSIWLIGSESYSGRCWHARIRSTRSTARPSTTPSSQVTNSFPSSCHYPEGQTDKSQIGKRPQIESTWDEQYATGMIAMWAPKVADRPSVREARLKLEAITIPSMDRMTSFSFSEGSSGYATYKREQDERGK